VAIAAALLLLAACGKATPTTPASLPPVQPIGVTPSAAPADDAALKALLARVQAAADATRNFSATAYTKMRTPTGGTDHNLAKIHWKRPGTMAATVLDAGVAKKKSTKLVFDGKHEVRVRTYFFGFIPLKITLDVEDPRLVDGYKRSLRDTSTERLLETLLHPQAEARLLGAGVSHGEDVDYVEVRSPLRWKGVDKDVFGISRRISLPVMRDAIDGAGRVIFHLEMREMTPNTTIPASEWTVD
jgi:hypothetical protein